MFRRRKSREPSLQLYARRVTIRPMERSDLDKMDRWRRFADPLYMAFDFPRRSSAELDHWFRWRFNDPTRRLYVIENEEQHVIGSLTLREIDGQRSARLGITLGADYVSQGYGSEALERFLDYYFTTLGFERMVLDVAAINQRAIRCYRNLDFVHVGQHYQPIDSNTYQAILKEPSYQHLRHFFRIDGSRPVLLFYDMELTHEAWRVHRSESLANRLSSEYQR